jgi:hypothetical protein
LAGKRERKPKPKQTHRTIPSENTSAGTPYGSPRMTSGAMYMYDPVHAVGARPLIRAFSETRPAAPADSAAVVGQPPLPLPLPLLPRGEGRARARPKSARTARGWARPSAGVRVSSTFSSFCFFWFCFVFLEREREEVSAEETTTPLHPSTLSPLLPSLSSPLSLSLHSSPGPGARSASAGRAGRPGPPRCPPPTPGPRSKSTSASPRASFGAPPGLAACRRPRILGRQTAGHTPPTSCPRPRCPRCSGGRARLAAGPPLPA